MGTKQKRREVAAEQPGIKAIKKWSKNGHSPRYGDDQGRPHGIDDKAVQKDKGTDGEKIGNPNSRDFEQPEESREPGVDHRAWRALVPVECRWGRESLSFVLVFAVGS